MIDRRRRSVLLTASAFLGVGIAAVSFVVTNQRALAQQAGDWVAFTATRVEARYDDAGKTAGFEEAVLAVRCDGSTVTSRTITTPAGKRAEQRNIRDLTLGMDISVEGMTESVTSMPIDSRAVERFRQRPVACTVEVAPLQDRILGYDVVRDVRDLPGPAGTFRRLVEWRAPALDCFPLRQTLFKGGSPAALVMVNDRNITSVTPGEPTEATFKIPPGYTERAPSKVLREVTRRYPQVGLQPCPTCTDAVAAVEQRDLIYQGSRGGQSASTAPSQ